jgi:transposase
MIPKQSGKRVKTDRIDAENLARYLRSGDLTEVWVPDETTESIRNLVRLREDARIARQKATAESVSSSQGPRISPQNSLGHDSH